jgi:hypothetical protein
MSVMASLHSERANNGDLVVLTHELVHRARRLQPSPRRAYTVIERVLAASLVLCFASGCLPPPGLFLWTSEEAYAVV